MIIKWWPGRAEVLSCLKIAAIMKRQYALLAAFCFAVPLLAASGGPDQYGYVWKDSFEPDGPVYSWIDISTTGFPITDLADDNTHGPFIMSGNMPYYWYDVKKIWIGSNGYVAFNGGNIAANFPALPSAGGTDNYVAVLMSDLTFGGAGNPAQCFLLDEPERLIVSWINVPFWNVNAPGYTGSNTFQLILNKQDSTITMQYQSTSGVTGSNGPVIGIESVTGSIGLARSQSLMPSPGYAVRFYNPSTPLLQVKDAAVEWVGEPGTGGITMSVGASLGLATQVANTGNQDLDAFTLVSAVINPVGQTVQTETITVPAMQAGSNLEPPLAQAFTPSVPGTYRHQVTISGVSGELVLTNNTMTREVVVYSATENVQDISWAVPADVTSGLGWNGGDGGIAVYIMAPSYPCQITGTTVRISSNNGSGYAMMLYDDDGPDGGPGTLLDSTVVPFAQGGAGEHVYPLATPVLATGGGYYVAWYMLGPEVYIAKDEVGPFSLRTYEVLGSSWAEYRERTTTDFYLGMRIQQLPFTDVGVTGLLGITNGQVITAPVTVQALVKNMGNIPVTNFPVSYSYDNGTVVTQTYSGNNIQPGNSALVTFSQPFVAPGNGQGQLCAWTSATNDNHPQNDSTCVSVNVAVGIGEHDLVALKTWPNPAHDRLYVEGLPGGPVAWTVVDARGTRVMEGAGPVAGGRLQVDLGPLATGAYVLRCVTDRAVMYGRFVRER